MATLCGGIPADDLEQLVKVQKRANSKIAPDRKYAVTLLSVQDLKWSNIKEMYIHCMLIVMYNHHHQLLSSIFSVFYI